MPLRTMLGGGGFRSVSSIVRRFRKATSTWLLDASKSFQSTLQCFSLTCQRTQEAPTTTETGIGSASCRPSKRTRSVCVFEFHCSGRADQSATRWRASLPRTRRSPTRWAVKRSGRCSGRVCDGNCGDSSAPWKYTATRRGWPFHLGSIFISPTQLT